MFFRAELVWSFAHAQDGAFIIIRVLSRVSRWGRGKWRPKKQWERYVSFRDSYWTDAWRTETFLAVSAVVAPSAATAGLYWCNTWHVSNALNGGEFFGGARAVVQKSVTVRHGCSVLSNLASSRLLQCSCEAARQLGSVGAMQSRRFPREINLRDSRPCPWVLFVAPARGWTWQSSALRERQPANVATQLEFEQPTNR